MYGKVKCKLELVAYVQCQGIDATVTARNHNIIVNQASNRTTVISNHHLGLHLNVK